MENTNNTCCNLNDVSEHLPKEIINVFPSFNICYTCASLGMQLCYAYSRDTYMSCSQSHPNNHIMLTCYLLLSQFIVYINVIFFF